MKYADITWFNPHYSPDSIYSDSIVLIQYSEQDALPECGI